MPANWTVTGTSGYDFLNQVNGLFVDSTSEAAIEDFYTHFIGPKWRYGDLIYSRKVQISLASLASEVNVLTRQLSRITEQDRHYRDFTLNNLRFAVREIIACFPVYRTYIVAQNGQVEKAIRFISNGLLLPRNGVTPLATPLFSTLGSCLWPRTLARQLSAITTAEPGKRPLSQYFYK